MISFANAQGSVKIRLACSKVLLLINLFDCRLLNTFKNKFWWRQYLIKGDKYFFFYKRRCYKCSLENKLFKNTPSNIKQFIERSM